jgi:GNAT superfamily N-acetyltransferase
MSIRPYRPGDRAEVLGLVGDVRAIGLRNHYVFVAEEGGAIVGVADGQVPDDGDVARLGAVVVRDARRWDVVEELLAALVEKAIGLGFKLGTATVANRRAIEYLWDRFQLETRNAGRNTKTGGVGTVEYEIDLRAFLKRLRGE